LDTPVEILHVFLLGVVKYLVHDLVGKLNEKQKKELEGRIESFNTSSLNMPTLQPKYLVTHVKSLIGKEFKIFLQAAPFILFPFMDDFEREIWLSLSSLSSYAFQTHIDDMEDFQLNLQKHLSNFLCRIVRLTAQWVNKPKFHILLHLADAIRRFGPATLFATEKFESYNGVLRSASTHSNRQAPGRDIAIKFSDFNLMRFSLSGGITYNEQTQTTSTSSPSILNFFQNTKSVQESMGYDPTASATVPRYPFTKNITLTKEEKVQCPQALTAQYPTREFQQISFLQTNKHDSIKKDHFVLVCFLLLVF
jgi:hypothetical protein